MAARRLQRPPATTPALYTQDGKGYGAIVHAHYFAGGCDWYVTEYDPDTDIAFGWACLGDPELAELGYVSLAELDEVSVPVRFVPQEGFELTGRQPVEYDEHWAPVLLREALDARGYGRGDR